MQAEVVGAAALPDSKFVGYEVAAEGVQGHFRSMEHFPIGTPCELVEHARAYNCVITVPGERAPRNITLARVDLSVDDGRRRRLAVEVPSTSADPAPSAKLKQEATKAAAAIGCTVDFDQQDGEWFVQVDAPRGTVRQRFVGSWPATLEHVGLR